MRQLASFSVLLIAGVLLSFSTVSKAPPAITTTTNEIVPFSMDIFISCANGGLGEMVHLEGSLHILTHVTINGNNISAKSHFQPQGVQGVGATTGDLYNATGVTQDQFKGSLTNGQAEFTYINNFRIIGQGPGNNFTVHQNVHQTFNANGDVTSTVNNSTADCD